MIQPKRLILIIILTAMFALFFFGGPDSQSARSFKSLWNFGHILFFALFPLLFLYSRFVSGSYLRQCALALASALFLGLMVELIQGGLNRSPDVGDLFRNMLGAMVCLFFLSPTRKILSKKHLIILQITTVILICFQIYGVLTAVADEQMARRQFPILSGFETPFEIQRWSGDADFEIDRRVKRRGKASMRVELNTSTYSGVSLKYFPEDWEGFNYFQFSIFNPLYETLSITCRIHDLGHIQGEQKYEDRFNRTFTIPRGWNTITIRMDDIRSAPVKRRMDIQHIKGVGIFATRLPRKRIINIDDVQLLP